MDSFPENVKQFLDAYIESIDQLEILRILAEVPTRVWDIGDLATQLQLTSIIAQTQVKALYSRGLLPTDAEGKGPLIRYGPQNPALELALSQVLQLYRERPVTMIRMVYAQANERLKAFADAFKLRKEK